MEVDKYNFIISIHTVDLAVLNCLRGLSQYAQRSGNNRMPWSEATDKEWQRDGRTVTFRFTTADYCRGFLLEARRLLPASLWSVVGDREDLPVEFLCHVGRTTEAAQAAARTGGNGFSLAVEEGELSAGTHARVAN